MDLRNDPRLADIEHKESLSETQAFYRTKVKLKKEIVTMGIDWIDPRRTWWEPMLKPREWGISLLVIPRSAHRYP